MATVIAEHLEAAASSHGILAAPEAEAAGQIAALVADLLARLREDEASTLRTIVTSGVIDKNSITIMLDPVTLAGIIGVSPDLLLPSVLSITAPFSIRRRGNETRIIAGTFKPAPDPTLRKMLSKARRWSEELLSGIALTEIARRNDCTDSYVGTRLQLAFLSPRIQAAILDGTQPPDLSVERLLRTGIALDWSEQERAFGFSR